MHLWHNNLEFWFTLGPCCQISRFMLMWRVQGGLSLLAVSRERRVMHPASPAARMFFANMQKAPAASSFALSQSLTLSRAPLLPSFSLPLPAPSTLSISSMAQQWIGSVPNRRNLDLPLIICLDYSRRRVVQRVSTQEHSRGQVFYCCPFHKVS